MSELQVVAIIDVDDTVIDLTGDEPPEKKILLESDKSLIAVNQGIACVSQQSSEQSLSNGKKPLLGSSSKRGGCFTCGNNSSKIIYLECKHRFCYNHFVDNLQQTKVPRNICFISECRQPISDEIIKDGLRTSDYISFLELSRENLRRVIQQQNIQLTSREELNTTGDLDSNKLKPNVLEESNNKPIEDAMLQGFNGQHDLESMSYIKNVEPFQCPICFVDFQIQEGVILENCLHSFCVECISATIQYSDEPRVLCPFISENKACEFFIQEREIRGIISPESYELHLRKALKRAEANLENIYHCKTLDCDGFIQYEQAVRAFVCPVCDKVNCVNCKAIHEEKTCEEYQFDLKNDVKNQKELKMTENAIKKMRQQGKAMLCPKCDILIQKDDGCDYVVCASCKLGICYRTKKPRHPLTKVINGVNTIIDGCHCFENGKKCHRNCGGCH